MAAARASIMIAPLPPDRFNTIFKSRDSRDDGSRSVGRLDQTIITRPFDLFIAHPLKNAHKSSYNPSNPGHTCIHIENRCTGRSTLSVFRRKFSHEVSN